MKNALLDKINEAIKEYQHVYGASLEEVVFALDVLHGYYRNEAIKLCTGEK